MFSQELYVWCIETVPQYTPQSTTRAILNEQLASTRWQPLSRPPHHHHSGCIWKGWKFPSSLASGKRSPSCVSYPPSFAGDTFCQTFEDENLVDGHTYDIAGKFGGNNVWWKWTNEDFGDFVTNNVDGFSLQTICQIHQTPSPAKLSHYTVYSMLQRNHTSK